MAADMMKLPKLAKFGASKGDDTTDADEEAEEGGDYSAVIGELFDAMKSDDREGFAEAFKAAVMSCK